MRKSVAKGRGQGRALNWVTAGGAMVRAGLAGAFALVVIFIVTWSVAQLPYGPGDLFIMLFTTASPASTDALQEGVLFAALVGFVAGGLVALGLIGFSFVQTAPLEWLRSEGSSWQSSDLPE